MNSQQIAEAWNSICEKIMGYPTINPSQMKAFFSRLVPQAMSEDFIVLTADNDFIKTWIERHYTQYIAQALKEIYNEDFTIAIEVDTNQEVPDVSIFQRAETQVPRPEVEETQDLRSSSFKEDDEVKHDEAPVHKSVTTSSASNLLSSTSTLTFENFVIGESNRMAYSMSIAVAEAPGKQKALNPLFIYGRSGLGKTHLMRAIQNYIAETRPELTTVYTDSADFLNDYVETVKAHDRNKTGFKTFKNKYQDSDILLIDDIQYFQGKEQTLDIVFQIFNKMIDEGKQVVLSADRAPKNITMDERYQSRFNSGGTIDIQPPELETKMGIIKSFVDEYRTTNDQPDFYIDEDIERYIAENSGSNIRELKSAVTKVIYRVNTFDSQELTIDELTHLLENHFSGGSMKKLTIADIQKQVEQYYDVPHQELVGKKRSRKIVYARQIAIYLSRQMLDQPYNLIGKSFGNRDHTTIMYSVTNVEEKMKESRELREEIENIKRRIKDR